jgi:hypothetical protein
MNWRKALLIVSLAWIFFFGGGWSWALKCAAFWGGVAAEEFVESMLEGNPDGGDPGGGIDGPGGDGGGPGGGGGVDGPAPTPATQTT